MLLKFKDEGLQEYHLEPTKHICEGCAFDKDFDRCMAAPTCFESNPDGIINQSFIWVVKND
jgi:hypothetical protein